MFVNVSCFFGVCVQMKLAQISRSLRAMMRIAHEFIVARWLTAAVPPAFRALPEVRFVKTAHRVLALYAIKQQLSVNRRTKRLEAST